MICYYYYYYYYFNTQNINLTSYQGSIKMAMGWRTRVPPLAGKAARVARVRTGEGDKQQQVPQGTEHHMRLRREMQNDKCWPRADWSNTPGRGVWGTEADPVGKAPSREDQGHTEKSAKKNRAKLGTQSKNRRWSEFPHKYGAASGSKRPNTRSVRGLEQPHYN